MNQVGFIGDIHGCIEELDELVAVARQRASHLVFLGDYVNRGAHSREVIEFLIGLQQTVGISTSFVMGNHDRAFLDALAEDRFDSFLRMGGASTVKSYVGVPRSDVLVQLRENVPATHVAFLRALETQVEVDNVVAMHDFPTTNANHTSGFRIYGHVPQRGLTPRVEHSRAFIDTGCGTLPGGRLTCLFWPTLDWIQSKDWSPIR